MDGSAGKKPCFPWTAAGYNEARNHIKAPEYLSDKTLSNSGIREETGCTVIAILRDGKMNINPEAKTVIKRDDELLLIGTFDAEKSFLRGIKS